MVQPLHAQTKNNKITFMCVIPRSARPFFVFLGLLVLFSGHVHSQNVIRDGGFELNRTSGPNTLSVFAPTNSSFGGWTAEGVGALIGMPYASIPANEGTEAMLLDTFRTNPVNGTLRQTFATAAGLEYTVSFAVNSISSLNGKQPHVRLLVTDGATANLDVTYVGAPEWTRTTHTFVATGTSTTITIEGVLNYPIVDDVRVITPNLLGAGGFELGLTGGPGGVSVQSTYGPWNRSALVTALLGMPYQGMPVYEGAEAMYVGNGGAVSQSFPTVAGQKSWLSLAVIGYVNGSGSVRSTVSRSGGGTDLTADIFAPGDNAWRRVSYEFVATSALSTVQVQNISGFCMIDDVRVTLVPLDEPLNALEFDGIDDHVRVQNFTNQPTSEVTVEFWQRVDGNKQQSTFFSLRMSAATGSRRTSRGRTAGSTGISGADASTTRRGFRSTAAGSTSRWCPVCRAIICGSIATA